MNIQRRSSIGLEGNVCRKAEGLVQLQLDLVAVSNHRQHRLANYFLAHFAETILETVERHNGFGHGTVAASAADIVVKLFHDVAGALDVADIAHANHHAVID